MLQLDSLPTETRRLLNHLSSDAAIGSFTLIGGTALALSWGHRKSEDLDFASPTHNLPRDACSAILRQLEGNGWKLDDISDPITRLYEENEGADLADSQQDWLCRHEEGHAGVKMTFFSEFLPFKQQEYKAEPALYGQVRVMRPENIFALKSQLLLRRTTLRDLFDINSFLDRGKRIEDVLAAVRIEHRHCSYEQLRGRLLPDRLPATDPGLASLVNAGPQTFEEVKAALQIHLDAYDQRLAAEILIEENLPSSRPTP